jgi:MFS family permease
MTALPRTTSSDHPGLRAIPGGIWALGLVSLFMDMSSELIHSLLPVFMVSVLGASVLTVGLIEGIAEAAAAITKVFSGFLSDYLGKRKFLTGLGYGVAALTKPLFALAPAVGWVFAARFADRIGKGIRGAPRDALIGDIAPTDLRGACFGLRQSLDTVGAVVGPLGAIPLMVLFADDFRAVFWVAVLPAILAVTILIIGVREPEHPRSHEQARTPLVVRDLTKLGHAYWWIVIIGTVLTLARFSEAFLVLRAESAGLKLALIPLVMVVMSTAYAACAYPAGKLSDRIPRWYVLAAGLLVLIVADIVLALAGNVWQVMVGITFWGVHMGLTQGLLATLVADTAPAAWRGSAFGLFNLLTGVALLAASVIAGWLWQRYGAPVTFFTGAVLTALALVGLIAVEQGRSHRQNGSSISRPD